MQNPGFESQDNVFIRRLSEIIVEHFSNDQFSVEQLSNEIGLSRSQLYRRLKQIKGLTISQFIRQVRLEEARKLLLSDTAPISEIAYLVGFNSPAYFHKCFQEYFGLTPGKMKKLGGAGKVIKAGQGRPEHETAAIAAGEQPEPQLNLPPGTNGWLGLNGNRSWSDLVFFLLFMFAMVSLLSYFIEEDPKTYRVVAILPMDYLPKSLEGEYWVKSLEETLRAELERLPDTRILSKASTLGVIRRHMLLPEMAEELQVDAIIEGSVLLRGDSVRMRMKLIKTHPVEQQLWAGEYPEHLKELKNDQQALVRHIARQINQRFRELADQY
jgi:AraC-like DNA-binding protein/TolB-like protein